MTLDDLEQLTKRATPGPWGVGTSAPTCIKTPAGKVIAKMGPDAAYDDDEYIAAVSPETVLKLIAIARAAEAVRRRLDRLAKRTVIGQTMREHGVVYAEDDALRAALDALDEDSI